MSLPVSGRSHRLNDLLVVHVWHKTPATQSLLLMAIVGVSGCATCKHLSHEMPSPRCYSGREAGGNWSIVHGQVLAAKGAHAKVIDVPHSRGLLFQKLLLPRCCPVRVQQATGYWSRSGPNPNFWQTHFPLSKVEPDLIWLRRLHCFTAAGSPRSGRLSVMNLMSPVVCISDGRQGDGRPMWQRHPQTFLLSLSLLSSGSVASLGSGEQCAEKG